VFVDGTEEGYRSLSHWPGNRTPPALKQDLSTGICLEYARLPAEEQVRLVGAFDTVCNNHYDTDGALSVLAMLRPEEALPRAGRMLAAAATGDFSTWQGPEALALELSVTQLPRHPRSPLRDRCTPSMTDAERWALAYEWLIEHLPGLLDDPFALRELWADQHAATLEDIRRIEAGTGVSVRDLADEDFALVSSDRPITSLGLHLAAGKRARVLLLRPARSGFRYRFFHRVESWFELVTRRTAPRLPLEPAVAALNAADPAARGGQARWWCTDIGRPIAELGFGDPARARVTHYGDPDLEQDAETRLPPSGVIDALRAAFRGSRAR
jgi:hypothetical protein